MENVGNIDEERGDKAIVDTLLSDTFNSILRIEERSLKNRLTEGLPLRNCTPSLRLVCTRSTL